MASVPLVAAATFQVSRRRPSTTESRVLRSSSTTKIVDRETGQVHVGKVPPFSVVEPGTLPGKPLPNGAPGPSLYCAVIVKTVDAQTCSKTSINELLRD